MKRFLVCSQLMLVILFVLQLTLPLHNTVNSLEYSVEERIYIVKSLHKDQQQQQQHLRNAFPNQPKKESYPHQSQQNHQPQPHHNHYQQIQALQQQHQQIDPTQSQAELLQMQQQHHNNQAEQNHFNKAQQINVAHKYHQLHTIEQQQQLYQMEQEHQQHDSQLQHQQQHNNQKSYDEQQQQHHSLANSMQQVLLDTVVSGHQTNQYQYQYTQIEIKHESTHQGEVNELYYNNIEHSYPNLAQDQLAYYQYQQQHHQPQHYLHHHHQHIMYSEHYNDDDSDYNDINVGLTQGGSCDSHYESSSILMQNDYTQEPTCRAPHANSHQKNSPVNVPNFSQFNNKQSHNNNNVETFPIAPQHYHYESSLISAIRHYWREVLGLCLGSAVFLNWLFVVIKRRFMSSGLTRAEHAIESIHQSTSRSVSKDTNSSAHDSAFEEIACPMSLEDIDSSKSSSSRRDNSLLSNKFKTNNISTNIRQRSSTLKAINAEITTSHPTEPIPIPIKTFNNHTTNLSISPNHNSLSTSFTNSLNSSEYNSRYSSDFDSIQRLGRGGFGIVFEARNKIDDCHYAVKRICLPLEKEARERVMREVRALAKLDHAGIVRYYNAWLETPPEEWLKQHDAQLGIGNSKDGMSFPSTDGIYDRNESEHITKGGNSKLGESGDNSSGLLLSNNSPFRRRPNGFRKFLKNNSSSPSLDIVFEGSGSIRLESENNTEKTDSSHDNKIRYKNGDNINSDSEDSDFIQFESKVKINNLEDATDNGCDVDFSLASQLTDPFSSSSSSSSNSNSEAKNDYKESSLTNSIAKKSANNVDLRKNALNYQKELRHLNNATLVENLHVEKVYLYIQMQLCRKDTLKDWLKTNCEKRDKTIIFDLFYQIVDAVEYVHSQDLIHRDLKPSNIFFSLDGTLKIGDFGLCRAKTSTGIGSSLDLQEYVAESEVERGFEAVHTEQVGTQLYMSPEQLNGLSYNQKVDIFAMGLILLELLIPFKTQMQRVNVLFKARNNLYSDEFKLDHPKEHDLVKSLLNRMPQKRPTANEIKQHDLLTNAQLSQPVIERIYHRRRTISSNSSTE